MRPRLSYVLTVAVVSLLSQTAINPGVAKVVRDGNGPVSNPAVEAGGHRLPSLAPPPVPYSLIGAIVLESQWMLQCAAWPWQQFGSFGWFRHRGPRHGAPLVSAFPARHPTELVPMRFGDGHH
jgi:hypothetical protein